MEPLTSSVCRSCRTRLTLRSTATRTSRTFTSSTRKDAIPPESPTFIDVPQSFQPTYVPPRPQKGYLPMPRDLFPDNRPEKKTAEYITRLTPTPKKELSPDDPDATPLKLYKQQMAALRKSHLRSSLASLAQRKTSYIRQVSLRSQRKQDESQLLRQQGPREDERLTNNSIPTALLAPQRQHNPAMARAIHNAKVANVQRTAAKKSTQRQDALHTLYVSARDFVTNEEQLELLIKREFEDKDFGGSAAESKKSYWEGQGPPDGVKQMVDGQWVNVRGGAEFTSSSAYNLGDQLGAATRKYRTDQERMKRIAEKLSGGKM